MRNIETATLQGIAGQLLHLRRGRAVDGTCAQLSPDWLWLAQVSDESGSYELYARPFTADGKLGGDKQRVSTGGGNQPRWPRGGQELFYVAAKAWDGHLSEG